MLYLSRGEWLLYPAIVNVLQCSGIMQLVFAKLAFFAARYLRLHFMENARFAAVENARFAAIENARFHAIENARFHTIENLPFLAIENSPFPAVQNT